MQSIVVTGVSTGIGLAIAQTSIQAGYRVFGSVRNAERGAELQKELGENFVPLVFDVRDAAGIERAVAAVQAQVGDEGLAALINNAGIAISGPLLHQPMEELRELLEINALAPIAMVRAFAPLLGVETTRRAPPGRVINISSVAGKMVGPFLGAYSGSKHALEAFSDGLRRELQLYGIDVIVVGPGSVESPIWEKAGAERLRTAYANTAYAEPIQRFVRYIEKTRKDFWPPHRIADVVLEALRAAHPKARYAPVAGRLTNWILPRLLPARWVDRLLAKSLKLTRDASIAPSTTASTQGLQPH